MSHVPAAGAGGSGREIGDRPISFLPWHLWAGRSCARQVGSACANRPPAVLVPVVSVLFPEPGRGLDCPGARPGEGGACRAVNMAHTIFPASPGVVQPHRSLNAQIICSPRPASAREPGVRGTGTALPGSATAHSTQGPCCSRPSRTGRRGRVSPGPGRACCSALVTISDTTIAMSWLLCAVSHRRKVARVKSRAARTDPACALSARVAIRGGQAQPTAAGPGDGCQLPPARPAISAASISQRQPALPARCDGSRRHHRPVKLGATRKQAPASDRLQDHRRRSGGTHRCHPGSGGPTRR